MQIKKEKDKEKKTEEKSKGTKKERNES